MISTPLSSENRIGVPPHLRFGFLLAPRFTLVAFAGFVDALRLAADDGDRSQQRLCSWKILGDPTTPIKSSCGASICPTAMLDDDEVFDYIVVVGGLMHGGQAFPTSHYKFFAICRVERGEYRGALHRVIFNGAFRANGWVSFVRQLVPSE